MQQHQLASFCMALQVAEGTCNLQPAKYPAWILQVAARSAKSKCRCRPAKSVKPLSANLLVPSKRVVGADPDPGNSMSDL